MRDGISLSADVYLPLGGQGLPTIVQWTPYESTRERFISWGVWFAKRGLCRGRRRRPRPLRVGGTSSPPGPTTARTPTTRSPGPPDEQWSNGRIGTWGRSYGGLVQWQLAHLGHPNLQCIAPQVIHDDYFWDGYWTGGAFQLALTLGAAALWSSAMTLITGPGARDVVLNDRIFGAPAADRARRGDDRTQGRLLAALVGAPGRTTSTGRRSAIDRRRSTCRSSSRAAGSTRTRGRTCRSFAAIGTRVPNRVLIGPWSHEEEIENFTGDIDLSPALTVIRDHELEFYDRYLKDVDNGWEDSGRRPSSTCSERTSGAASSEWPLAAHAGDALPPAAERRPVRRRAAARTSRPTATTTTPPIPVPTIGGVNSVLTMTQGAETPIRPGPIDQRVLERRDDVLVYTSEPLDDDLEVIGPVEMVLYAASSARDTDFIVRLCDVYPDGRSILLTEGHHPGALPRQRRGRVGGAARARRGRRVPDPLLPGRECLPARPPHPARRHELELPALLAQPQHRRGRRQGTRMQVAHQTVLHTSGIPSRVVLPVIRP